MRLLLDILHPAHVHFFKHFRVEMQRRGHGVFVTARSKDINLELLHAYEIPYELLSHETDTRIGSVMELVSRTARLVRLSRKTEADVLIGIMGVSVAPAARVLRKKSIVFYDTEIARASNSWVFRLAHHIVTPRSYTASVPGSHITYPGYHELAYLHPNRFTPDPTRLHAYGLSSEQPYALLRFVSRGASHDFGHRWLSSEDQERIVSALEEEIRVVISSEIEPTGTLADRRLRGPVEDIHHVVAHAQLVLGESATMSSEAAVLGVPAYYIAERSRGYLDDLERRYGLVRVFRPDQGEEAVAMALRAMVEERFRGAHKRLLAESADVTYEMVNIVEDLYSDSSQTASSP